MNGRDPVNTVPLEHFIQAITSQLDRAQTALALKARAGLPLTFAVRDLTLDLRTHVEVDGATVRIRPAGPGDRDASTLHIALTTITRPMMEENTLQLAADPGEIGLQEVAGDDLSEEDMRRLEWAGIHTVSQLRQVSEQAVERVANVPAMRLRAALDRAAQPLVRDISTQPRLDAPDETPLVRLRGRNLRGERLPLVRMNGEDVRVVESREHARACATRTPDGRRDRDRARPRGGVPGEGANAERRRRRQPPARDPDRGGPP